MGMLQDFSWLGLLVNLLILAIVVAIIWSITWSVLRSVRRDRPERDNESSTPEPRRNG